jgi:uncharacterized protein YqjF (DUF2071 family)
MHPALSHTAHRPWPVPDGPWVGRQSWRDLLFAHWPIEVARIRHLVPAALTIQEFGGSSWIGLVPFRMQGVMLRGLPDLPGISAFPELNVRLYVELDGKAGVWFLSLDADQALAVWAARTFLHLPYHRAAMSLRSDAGVIEYDSQRRDGTARYRARYRPVGDVSVAQPGSLEHWLTERYCLYAATPSGELRRMEVQHAAWPLQQAEVETLENSMFEPHGITVSGPPFCHFARRLDVVFWPPIAPMRR